MPLFILSLLIQVALVIHIVKTGRNTTWIYIVMLLPVAGAIAYLVIEVLAGGRTGRKAKKALQNTVAPNKDIKAAARDYAVADTVENSVKLAEECLEKGLFEDARQFYEKCLTGIHQHDPDIMHGLAKAEFGLAHYTQTKSVLDALIRHNPDYKNADAHLLYARTAEALGDDKLADEEYKALHDYYPGAEATYRYALFLDNQGEHDKAKQLLDNIIHLSKVSGKHYNTVNKEWIALSKQHQNNNHDV